jgi:hypothetical protein
VLDKLCSVADDVVAATGEDAAGETGLTGEGRFPGGGGGLTDGASDLTGGVVVRVAACDFCAIAVCGASENLPRGIRLGTANPAAKSTNKTVKIMHFKKAEAIVAIAAGPFPELAGARVAPLSTIEPI